MVKGDKLLRVSDSVWGLKVDVTGVIKDSLNDLLIPVLLYMAVILVMINTAYLRNVNSVIRAAKLFASDVIFSNNCIKYASMFVP